MNHWILKELRALVLTDLKEFIPEDYFKNEIESFNLNNSFKGNKHLSLELRWGHLATKLGQSLYFDHPNELTARQVSASFVLMNLGMLVASEAALNATKQISNKAIALNSNDENSGNVALQLEKDAIPTFKKNISSAFEQYSRHLTLEELKPYIPLLADSQQQEIKAMYKENSKVINSTINVSGSVNGSIQVGESNIHTKNDRKDISAMTRFYEWLLAHLGEVIISLVLLALTSWLGLG